MKGKTRSMTTKFSIKRSSIFLLAIGTMILVSSSIAFSVKQQGWTKSQEKLFYDRVYNMSSIFNFSPEQRKEYCNCSLNEFKKYYPNGIRGVSQEQASKTGKQVGDKCFTYVKTVSIAWNAQSEKVLKNYIINLDPLKSLPLVNRQRFADCVLEKLKTKYPDGIKEIPEKDAIKYGDECAYTID